MDEQAAAEGRIRSELFREAVRQYLVRRERWGQIFAYGESVATEQGLSEAPRSFIDRIAEEDQDG